MTHYSDDIIDDLFTLIKESNKYKYRIKEMSEDLDAKGKYLHPIAIGIILKRYEFNVRRDKKGRYLNLNQKERSSV